MAATVAVAVASWLRPPVVIGVGLRSGDIGGSDDSTTGWSGLGSFTDDSIDDSSNEVDRIILII